MKVSRNARCGIDSLLSLTYRVDVLFQNPVVGAESTMRQVIEVIEANAAWLKRDERHIFEFFRER